MRRQPLLAAAMLVALPACRTFNGASETKEPVVKPVRVERSGSGYFVSIDADAKSQAVVGFYDRLYDALHTFNRKKASASGALDTYLEEYEAANGYTRLSSGGDEIECDREKCLLRLSARSIRGKKNGVTLATELTEALALSGIKPVVTGSGPGIQKTYAFGDKASLYVSCRQTGVGNAAQHVCEFDLEKGLAEAASDSVTMHPEARGRLTDCSLSPGTVKTANEAREQTDHSSLVKLMGSAGPGGKQVGYVHVVQQPSGVELIGLYLCGDLSSDAFAISGDARRAIAWVPQPIKVGAQIAALGSVQQDDVDMRLSTKVVDVGNDAVTVDAAFKLVRSGSSAQEEEQAASEIYGEDRFYIRLPKAWLNMDSKRL